MGKGSEGLQEMREEIHAANQGALSPVQVGWLANPHSIREQIQTGKISTSSVVFVVEGNQVVQRLVKEGIKAVGVWYQVESFTNIGTAGRCDLCCGCGHIETKCSSKSVCCYCSGSHRTCTHECNVVGCIAMQGSPCYHTQEKCPNCNGNHIACSSRCAKKAEATREAWERRRREPARWTTQTTGSTSGSNRTAPSLRASAPEGEERVGSEEEMADAEEGAAEAKDFTMVQSTMLTIMATAAQTAMGTATPATNGWSGIERKNRTDAAAPDV